MALFSTLVEKIKERKQEQEAMNITNIYLIFIYNRKLTAILYMSVALAAAGLSKEEITDEIIGMLLAGKCTRPLLRNNH